MDSKSVREPTNTELAGMTDLQSVFSSAGAKGEISFDLCQAGSLIKAIGGDDDMSIEDFAPCGPAEYEITITEQWRYSTQIDDDG